MFDKLKTYQNHPWLHKVQDVRVLGQLGFVVVVLLVSWSGVKVIQKNYELQQEMSRMQQEIAVQQLKNDNLKLKNEYYKSSQYLELAARQNFGLGVPGEKVLIVPKEVALAHVPPVDVPKAVDEEPNKAQQPFFAKNIQGWMDFFMHRQRSI